MLLECASQNSQVMAAEASPRCKLFYGPLATGETEIVRPLGLQEVERCHRCCRTDLDGWRFSCN